MGLLVNNPINLVIKKMNRILKIPTWNVNGLAKHLQEIKTFIFSQKRYITYRYITC